MFKAKHFDRSVQQDYNIEYPNLAMLSSRAPGCGILNRSIAWWRSLCPNPLGHPIYP